MQMRRDATRKADRSFIAIFTRFSNPGRGAERSIEVSPTMSLPLYRIIDISFFENIRTRAIYSKRQAFINHKTMLLFASKVARKGHALHARREIFNGNKLSRNGKVDSLIFPGMRLSRRIQWNRVEKGTESRAHLCHFT